MWECQNCHERNEDTFEVCWNCGASRAGVKDAEFQAAEQVDPESLQGSFAAADRTDDSPEQSSSQQDGDDQTSYEFTTEQHEVIGSLASNMKIVGIVSLISGGGLLVAGCLLFDRGGVFNLVQGLLALAVAGFTLAAADSFRQIVDSRGDDVANLMSALRALRGLYWLQVMLLFALLLGLLAAVAFGVLTFR